MQLITAILAYIGAGIFLFTGLTNESLMTAMVAAVLMAVGNYNVKQYKQNK